jgi:hypothetical protein
VNPTREVRGAVEGNHGSALPAQVASSDNTGVLSGGTSVISDGIGACVAALVEASSSDPTGALDAKRIDTVQGPHTTVRAC